MLSACQTGLGKITSGDDVIGMNRAFLYAGTNAVMSSLWRVSDISTALLVKQFYREYQTRPKAESLNKAMRHVKKPVPLIPVTGGPSCWWGTTGEKHEFSAYGTLRQAFLICRGFQAASACFNSAGKSGCFSNRRRRLSMVRI